MLSLFRRAVRYDDSDYREAELVCRCFSVAAATVVNTGVTGGSTGTRYFGLDKTGDVWRGHSLLRANRDRMWDYAT